MKTITLTCLVAAALSAQAPKTHLKAGDAAPDFKMGSTAGKPVTLSEFKGKNPVVLAFFPMAFTGG